MRRRRREGNNENHGSRLRTVPIQVVLDVVPVVSLPINWQVKRVKPDNPDIPDNPGRCSGRGRLNC